VVASVLALSEYQSAARTQPPRARGATQALGGAPLANLGDGQSDLVYTPLTPCRIIDTRIAGGPIAAGGTRDFQVTGNNLAAQGGSATGCGVPIFNATAAVINFVAVDAQGAGDLRITPFGTPMPLAAILNYAKIPGVANFNLANGLPVAICAAGFSCTFDFTLQADASATDIVADVQGYFRSLRTEQVKSFVRTASGGFAQIGRTCGNWGGVVISFRSAVAGTVVVHGTTVVNFHHVTAEDLSAAIYIGLTGTDCSSPTGESAFVYLPGNMPQSDLYDFPIPVRRVVHIAAGAPTAFSLNSIFSTPCTASLCPTAYLQGSAIQATFIPD
jgi:hypothetical protein